MLKLIKNIMLGSLVLASLSACNNNENVSEGSKQRVS